MSVLEEQQSSWKEKQWFGQGNAKKGYREEYNLYEPTEPPTEATIHVRLAKRISVWHSYCLFDPQTFQQIANTIRAEWSKPRYGATYKLRKHSVEVMLFGFFGIVMTGMSFINMEGLAQAPGSLFHKDFPRILRILDKEYGHELTLMSAEEKQLCIGSTKSNPYIVYICDGCDFPLEISVHKWMFLTHKKNIKNRAAIRAQIVIDSLWGYFRAVETDCAGLMNDQAMLKNSTWNAVPDTLTSGDERVATDGGYWSTENISVCKPFSQDEIENDEQLGQWNKVFNGERGLIERNFGIFKRTFRIFDQPWRHDKMWLPLCLRVCLKLMNKYWRLPQNTPPGLQRLLDRDD